MGGSALAARYWVRLRCLCCEAWGLSPPAFDTLAAEGKLALEDAIELALMRAALGPDGAGMVAWIFRERESDRRARLSRAQMLMMRARAEKNPERKAALAAQLDEINRR